MVFVSPVHIVGISRIKFSCESMRDKWRKHFADVVANNEISDRVAIGFIAIDDGESRAVSFGDQRKAGRRPNHQRRADREKKIAGLRKFMSFPHGGFWHGLAERYSRRLDESTAVRTIRGAPARSGEFRLDPGQFVALAAVKAGGIGGVAVQFHNVGRGNA